MLHFYFTKVVDYFLQGFFHGIDLMIFPFFFVNNISYRSINFDKKKINFWSYVIWTNELNLLSWTELYVNFKQAELELKKKFDSKSSQVSNWTNFYRVGASSDEFDSTWLIFSPNPIRWESHQWHITCDDIYNKYYEGYFKKGILLFYFVKYEFNKIKST